MALATAVGINDYKRIALMDVFKSYFYGEFSDNDDASMIKDSDDAHGYCEPRHSFYSSPWIHLWSL